MPPFEYACRSCACEFELIVFASTVPACPACHGTDLARKPSVFAGVSKQPGPPRSHGRKGYVSEKDTNPSFACPVTERD